ncbi:hypothetical protein DBR11_20930 [Pedobacter sp. HMWF019]|uniref:hypothetical protein n=1 Tax=Pedobacter sp. HMWF019 TaxID=2056856 RepID=UPI000D3CE787|nr:hypothetical protein [Pedobacter sp. HMWF019]PTS95646.1 hypothetical protein DBR11_20930 [Pedobacter sp. HMWF019]
MQLLEHLTRLQYIGIVLFFVGYHIRLNVRRIRYERRRSGEEQKSNFDEDREISYSQKFTRWAGNLIRLFGVFLVVLDWLANLPMK